MDWDARFAQLDAENKAAGRCPNCGGSGEVAAMREINRTGNPYANRRCGRCKGTGKYPWPPSETQATPPPSTGQEETP